MISVRDHRHTHEFEGSEPDELYFEDGAFIEHVTCTYGEYKHRSDYERDESYTIPMYECDETIVRRHDCKRIEMILDDVDNDVVVEGDDIFEIVDQSEVLDLLTEEMEHLVVGEIADDQFGKIDQWKLPVEGDEVSVYWDEGYVVEWPPFRWVYEQ